MSPQDWLSTDFGINPWRKSRGWEGGWEGPENPTGADGDGMRGGIPGNSGPGNAQLGAVGRGIGQSGFSGSRQRGVVQECVGHPPARPDPLDPRFSWSWMLGMHQLEAWKETGRNRERIQGLEKLQESGTGIGMSYRGMGSCQDMGDGGG